MQSRFSEYRIAYNYKKTKPGCLNTVRHPGVPFPVTHQHFTGILKFRVISKHLNLLSKNSPNVAPFLKLMKKGICH